MIFATFLISSPFCSEPWWSCPRSYSISSTQEWTEQASTPRTNLNNICRIYVDISKGVVKPACGKRIIYTIYFVRLKRSDKLTPKIWLFQSGILKFASFGSWTKGASALFTRSWRSKMVEDTSENLCAENGPKEAVYLQWAGLKHSVALNHIYPLVI